jgi:hypothetical protein
MSAWLTAADLRAVADALDAFEEATATTGVTIAQYSDQHIRLRDVHFPIRWSDEAEPGSRYSVAIDECHHP